MSDSEKTFEYAFKIGPDVAYKVTAITNPDEATIKVIEQVAQYSYEQIIELKSKACRDALVSMGWVPPEDGQLFERFKWVLAKVIGLAPDEMKDEIAQTVKTIGMAILWDVESHEKVNECRDWVKARFESTYMGNDNAV